MFRVVISVAILITDQLVAQQVFWCTTTTAINTNYHYRWWHAFILWLKFKTQVVVRNWMVVLKLTYMWVLSCNN